MLVDVTGGKKSKQEGKCQPVSFAMGPRQRRRPSGQDRPREQGPRPGRGWGDAARLHGDSGPESPGRPPASPGGSGLRPTLRGLRQVRMQTCKCHTWGTRTQLVCTPGAGLWFSSSTASTLRCRVRPRTPMHTPRLPPIPGPVRAAPCAPGHVVCLRARGARGPESWVSP